MYAQNLQIRIILVADIYLPSLPLTVSITDIDGRIATFQESLSLLHRSHHEYIEHLQALAMTRFVRYKSLHQKEDLDKSILHFTEAIFLLPIKAEPPLSVVKTLFHLASVLNERSEKFKQPEDNKYAMEYLRHVRRFPLDLFDVSRTVVTTWLIRALKTHVRLSAGNGTQYIKEMVILCHELLSSRKSAVIPALIPAAAFSYLREAANIEFNRGLPTEMLDEVIGCLRDAVTAYPPDSFDAWHKVMLGLAFTLGIRFVKTHSKEDYEEASLILERILEPGGCPDSFRELPSAFSIVLANGRSAFFREPEYHEIVISRIRAYSSLHEGLPSFASTFAIHTRFRFREYSLEESLEEANSYVSQPVHASSSSSLEESAGLPSWSEAVQETYSVTDIKQKIEHFENILSITPPGTEPHRECLIHLENWYKSKFRFTDHISDIKESIKYSRLSLDATHASDPWRHHPLRSLRDNLLFAFNKTRKISYLDESITIGYDILECKISQIFHFDAIEHLVWSLLTRGRELGRIEDRLEAMRLMSVVIDNEYGREPDRFKLSCEWAIVARRTHHPTTLTAYKSAMSLMQRSLSFAPTVSIQHTRLVAMGEDCQTMPLDYASYQIHLGQFEEAVETLEQGRTLLWSEMRGLRTPVFQLIGEDSSLAKKFSEINQELETLTMAATPSGRPEVEDGVHQHKDGTDPFGRLVIKRKKLVEERDALTSQIQSRPGLEGFLQSPSFTTLRSAASRGPVIIINHCEWRSDIMIVFHNSLPCAIPTAKTFFTHAKKLRDELVEARKKGLDSVEYQDALCSVLKGLYEIVGEPVIKRLRVLGVPEQSRIWWCPTSVFCSLPLHAMGPIPSGGTRDQYFSDLYIPSYTPSLSALIESRQANQQMQMQKRPSLLLVAQPDDLLPGVHGEIKVIQRALQTRVAITGLVSAEASPSSVLEGLQGSQFAHFACHGVLETGKPFDASFKLHGGSRLTLLDIVRSRLPDAEFAFLSCCHAAEITEDSIADEALHLTAAMQYCGFRSVVGTMWEMADVDGRDLAKHFYKSLFSKQDSSVPYYERSAEALRDATQKLREKRGISLERWVNFVHYGA
jgi:CHAT domain-containing protein/tetratricopeptide (TPR) repeat protein